MAMRRVAPADVELVAPEAARHAAIAAPRARAKGPVLAIEMISGLPAGKAGFQEIGDLIEQALGECHAVHAFAGKVVCGAVLQLLVCFYAVPRPDRVGFVRAPGFLVPVETGIEVFGVERQVEELVLLFQVLKLWA